MKGYAALLLADGSEPIDPGYRRQPCEYREGDTLSPFGTPDGRWVAVISPLTFGPFAKSGYVIRRGAIFDLPLGGREIAPRFDVIPAVTTGPEPLRTSAARRP